MEIKELSAIEIRDKILNKELTCLEVINAFIKNCEDKKEYNAIIEIFYDAREKAKELDAKIANGFKGKLAGVPVIIKDNIMYEGKICSNASKITKNYVALYSATVVNKMIEEGAIILARANMDEFAMGSSTQTSIYGITHNPIDFDRVPGGSSGGSAAAVGLNLCPVALGSDTAGSVRQPASYCGVIGLKPTYGRISRYGISPLASSLDAVGILTKTIEDNALMLEVLSGSDKKDMTASITPVENYLENLKNSQKYTVGIPKEILPLIKGTASENNLNTLIEKLKALNVEIKEVSIPNIEIALPIYYTIMSAEATSNLARFDGVSYTTRSESASNLEEIYKKSRSEGFGEEAQRRIMLGNFVSCSENFNDYFIKAKNIQYKLMEEFDEAFNNCDLMLLPTTMGEAYKIGSKQNPIETNKEDILTVAANLVEIPAISIPYGKGENGLPLGIQLMANKFQEGKILSFAKFIKESVK